jgi:hypothetical protein
MNIRKSLLGVVVAGIVCCLSTGQSQSQEGQGVITCVGAEDMPGYGPLTFRFFPNGRVEMTDADGSAAGNWCSKGNQVWLAFHNGALVYCGSVQGNRLYGQATNGATSWNWQVQLVGTGPQGAPPMPPPVMPVYPPIVPTYPPVMPTYPPVMPTYPPVVPTYPVVPPSA